MLLGTFCAVAAQPSRGGGPQTLVKPRMPRLCSRCLRRRVRFAMGRMLGRSHRPQWMDDGAPLTERHCQCALWGAEGMVATPLRIYVVCRRMRTAVEAAIGMPSRHMRVSQWMGINGAMTAAQRAQAAQRLAMACLAYHCWRAKSRAAGEPWRFSQNAQWVLSLARLAREVLAIVPLVVRCARRRRRFGALQHWR